jgi:hypothetical protein
MITRAVVTLLCLTTLLSGARKHRHSNHTIKHVTYSTAGDVVQCLFCDISNDVSLRRVLWYLDDRVVVFLSNKMLRARLHFLVVPRAHVEQLTDGMTRTPGILPLLDHMRAVGERILSVVDAAGVQLSIGAGPPPSFFVPGSFLTRARKEVEEGFSSFSAQSILAPDAEEGPPLPIPPSPPPAALPGGCRLAFHRPPFNSVGGCARADFPGPGPESSSAFQLRWPALSLLLPLLLPPSPLPAAPAAAAGHLHMHALCPPFVDAACERKFKLGATK